MDNLSLEQEFSPLLNRKRYYIADLKRFIDYFKEHSSKDNRKTSREFLDILIKATNQIDIVILKRLIVTFLILFEENESSITTKIQNFLFFSLDGLVGTVLVEKNLVKLFELKLFQKHFSESFSLDIYLRYCRFLLKSISITNLHYEIKLKCVRRILDLLYDNIWNFKNKLDRNFPNSNFGIMSVDEINQVLKYFDSDKVNKMISNSVYTIDSKKRFLGDFDFASIKIDLEPKKKKIKIESLSEEDLICISNSSDDTNTNQNKIEPVKELNENSGINQIKMEVEYIAKETNLDINNNIESEKRVMDNSKKNSYPPDMVTIQKPNLEVFGININFDRPKFDLNDSFRTVDLNNQSFNELANDMKKVSNFNQEPEEDHLKNLIVQTGMYTNSIVLLFKSVPVLKFKTFHNYSSIKLLKMNNCGISILDTKNFDCLPCLELLSLRSNHLSELEANVFSGMLKLSQIDLRNNQIKHLDKNVFNSLKNLKKIDVSLNCLKSLDHDLFKSQHFLEEMDFSGNQIENLDSGLFDQCRNLKKLNFSNNSIEVLKENLFSNLRNITELTFSNNKICYLSNRLLKSLSKLKFVNFSNNEINELNHELFSNCFELKMVHFSDNKIKAIPTNIFYNQNNLYLVNFNSNQIQSISENLFKFSKSLTRIYFSNNKLNNVSMNLFNGLTKLEEVNFSRNNGKIIDDTFLRSISPNIKYVL